MHHWWVKENVCKSLGGLQEFSKIDAKRYMEKNFGLHTKYWFGKGSQLKEVGIPFKTFAVFFISSEKEWVGFTDHKGRSDEYDQTEQLMKFVEVCEERELPLIVRLHPNFGKNGVAMRESRYWFNVLKNLPRVLVIDNADAVDSYELARNAQLNAVYRSSLAAEFAFRELPFICCAESAFTHTLTSSLAVDITQMRSALSRTFENSIVTKEEKYWYSFAKYNALIGENLSAYSMQGSIAL